MNLSVICDCYNRVKKALAPAAAGARLRFGSQSQPGHWEPGAASGERAENGEMDEQRERERDTASGELTLLGLLERSSA